MADEPELTADPVVVPDTPEVPAGDTPAPQSGGSDPARPHPLEPGGERFEQVYARMRQAERDAADARERIARLEAQSRPTQPKEQYYTHEQLQALVDQGRITPGAMSQQLAYQAKELGKQEIRQEFVLETRRQDAAKEVDQYISKRPSLLDTSSEEFQRVARAAREIAQDMTLDVSDPRVQRRALRESLGTLDRLTQVQRTQQHDRAHGDTHAETSRGGGQVTPTAPDVLKQVPKSFLDQWQRWGYSQERMLREAKIYVERPPRVKTAGMGR